MAKAMVNIGLIGYGYWGPNLLRNFYGNALCNVAGVCDLRTDRLAVVKKTYQNIRLTTEATDIISDPAIDAVIIATPCSSHYLLTKSALLAGKHVLVEKPFTANLAEARELVELAQTKGLLLMVDHTYLYTPAVEKIKQLVEQGELGTLKYLDSTRINLGLFQSDVNVLWDLAAHDLSIMLYIHQLQPFSVNATGISHTSNRIENIAYLTVNFDSSFFAHFNCSWASPVKVRNMLIGGEKKVVLFNDLEPTEKVKVYDTGYTITNDEDKAKFLIDYRTGDVFIPKLENREALAVLTEDFLQSIIQKKSTSANITLALQVVSILEAAQRSIKNNGKEIKL